MVEIARASHFTHSTRLEESILIDHQILEFHSRKEIISPNTLIIEMRKNAQVIFFFLRQQNKLVAEFLLEARLSKFQFSLLIL